MDFMNVLYSQAARSWERTQQSATGQLHTGALGGRYQEYQDRAAGLEDYTTTLNFQTQVYEASLATASRYFWNRPIIGIVGAHEMVMLRLGNCHGGRESV